MTSTFPIRRVERTTLVLLGAAVLGSLLWESWAISLGVAAGGLLMLTNLRVLTALIQKTAAAVAAEARAEAAGASEETPKQGGRKVMFAIVFVAKNTALFAAIWMLGSRGYVDMVGLGVGVSTLVVAIALCRLTAGAEEAL